MPSAGGTATGDGRFGSTSDHFHSNGGGAVSSMSGFDPVGVTAGRSSGRGSLGFDMGPGFRGSGLDSARDLEHLGISGLGLGSLGGSERSHMGGHSSVGPGHRNNGGDSSELWGDHGGSSSGLGSLGRGLSAPTSNVLAAPSLPGVAQPNGPNAHGSPAMPPRGNTSPGGGTSNPGGLFGGVGGASDLFGGVGGGLLGAMGGMDDEVSAAAAAVGPTGTSQGLSSSSQGHASDQQGDQKGDELFGLQFNIFG